MLSFTDELSIILKIFITRIDVSKWVIFQDKEKGMAQIQNLIIWDINYSISFKNSNQSHMK